MSIALEQRKTNIGRMAVIGYRGHQYLGNVIDLVAGTPHPKRIRIQYDPELQGKVVMPGQYAFIEWKDEDDI